MKLRILALCVFMIGILSTGFMSKTQDPAQQVATYYDLCLDTLLQRLNTFHNSAAHDQAPALLKNQFLVCRIQYKKASMFVEQFDSRSARLLNGPDLLRIGDDTQNDSIKPHGFQHIEALLYAAKIERKELKQEVGLLIKNVQTMRSDPDHQYYFRNDKIWEAVRSGTYRIISMGITGFDVPIALNILPETKAQLIALRQVISIYKDEIESKSPELFKASITACDNCIRYVASNKDFNHFDRLSFIKDQLNPLSGYLKEIATTLHYINTAQRTPLNPNAQHLFDRDIFDLDFFSPNERYRNTPERVALGKRLFYEKRLSLGNSRSCATCHKPEMAFTDGLVKGKNINGATDLLRNTPTLWNSVFQSRQFYDSRALVLETQLSAVVHSAEEMGGSLIDIIPVLQGDTQYNAAFALAYKNDKEHISQYTIANAISCYVRSLVSFDSRFDKYMRGESKDYSAAEQNGFNLFMGKAKCGTCHYAPMFNGLVPPRYEETESEILAVPVNNKPNSIIDADGGKFLYTKTPLHRYAFKTPGIRNIALTAPYMHNGVFPTLEAVIDFYNNGGGAGVGIKLETQTLPKEKLHLNTQEKKDLISFMKSLTDTSALH